MSESAGRLFVYTKDRALEMLTQGIALSLNLDYTALPQIGELNIQPERTQPSAAVVDVSGHNSYPRAKGVSHDLHIPVIIIFDKPTPGRIMHAVRNGAIACLSIDDAMHSLVYLLENVFRVFSDEGRNQVLPIAGKVLLTLPGLSLSDGHCEERLPPIPGRLLFCLASRPNVAVSHLSLIRSAWGGEGHASTRTLHQQMHNLREVLAGFGVSHLVRTVRGHGYMLERDNLSAMNYG